MIRQTLLANDYRKALYTHYFSRPIHYINLCLGIVILVAVVTAWALNRLPQTSSSMLLVFLSLLLVCRPALYVWQMTRVCKSIPDFGKEQQIEFSEAGITTTTPTATTTLQYASIYAYLDKKQYLYLYLSKHQFVIIDKEQAGTKEAEKAVDLVRRNGVKKR